MGITSEELDILFILVHTEESRLKGTGARAYHLKLMELKKKINSELKFREAGADK